MHLTEAAMKIALKKQFAPLSAAVILWALACPVSAQLFYTQGHGDIGVGYEAGELHPHWHLGPGAVVNGSPLVVDEEYEPGDLIAVVPNLPSARPAGSEYDILGVSAGANIWVLPQTGAIDRPDLGLATEELEFDDWTTQIRFELTGFSGPGDFTLFRMVAGSPVFYMATSDGINPSQDFRLLSPGGHQHYNWVFTAPGTYDITLTISGTHAVDGFKSATETFTFNVVPEPSTFALIGLSLFALAVLRGRRRLAV